LGAANLRDIGFHFLHTDNRWKGIAAWGIVNACGGTDQRKKGCSMGNIDAIGLAWRLLKLIRHIPANENLYSRSRINQ